MPIVRGNLYLDFITRSATALLIHAKSRRRYTDFRCGRVSRHTLGSTISFQPISDNYFIRHFLPPLSFYGYIIHQDTQSVNTFCVKNACFLHGMWHKNSARRQPCGTKEKEREMRSSCPYYSIKSQRRHPQKAKKPPSGGIFYYFLALLHALSRIIASILCATAIKSAC